MDTSTAFTTLPERIRQLIPDEAKRDCIAVFKTTYKPNPNTPTLWLIMYKGGFMCCSTAKNCVYKKLPMEEIDSIRIAKGVPFGLPRLEFVFKDLSVDDFVVTFPRELDFEKVAQLLKNHEYQVL